MSVYIKYIYKKTCKADHICRSGLKLGQVIWIIRVNWVAFCLDQAGLTQFIKYPGLTWILYWIMRVNIGVWSQPK